MINTDDYSNEQILMWGAGRIDTLSEILYLAKHMDSNRFVEELPQILRELHEGTLKVVKEATGFDPREDGSV